MKPSRIIALFSALSLISCTSSNTDGEAGAPTLINGFDEIQTAENGAAPISIAGSQMRYEDTHGTNTFTFLKGGKYTFATVARNEMSADNSSGSYAYTTIAPGIAMITTSIHGNINLTFDSPLDATGTIDGDARKYDFTFIRPDGE